MGPWEIVGTLADGGTLVLYDGAPDYPGPDRLWAFVERHRVNVLGVSPTLDPRAHGARRRARCARTTCSSLRVLASTGEPWNEGPWRWYFDVVGGGRCPVINISGGTEVGACFLSPHVVQPLSPCSLGGPALGMAVDVFDDDGRLGARRGRRARVHEAVAGHDARACTAIRSATSTRTGRAGPGVWWHGDFASVDATTASGSCTAVPTTRSRSRASGSGRPRSRRSSSRIPAVLEAAAVGVPDELKGEALWVFVVLGAGRRRPTTRCAPSSSTCVVDALGPVVQARGRCGSPTALPKTRSAKVLRRAIRSVVTGDAPGDLSGLEDPAALDAIAVAHASGAST